MKYEKCLVIVAVAATFVLHSASLAEPVTIAHYDADSATTAPRPYEDAGWTDGGWNGTFTAASGVKGDENVWSIVANFGNFVYYGKNFDPNALSNTDWTATTRVQIQYATSAVGAVMFSVNDGQSLWTIGYQLTSVSDNGWTYIKADGTYAAQQPENVDAMQTWQMVFTAATQTMEYYLDGVKVGPTLTRSDVPDVSEQEGNFIRWGKQTTLGASTTHHWNYVNLEAGSAGCGSPQYPYPKGDISGPDAFPDCRVDLWDLAAIAENWLVCTYNCD